MPRKAMDVLHRLAGRDACPGDSLVSWLHYRVTTSLLISSSVILGFYQHFGDPITCLDDAYSGEVYQQYCWVYGTVSLPDADTDVITRYEYYRWVWLVLLMQAGALYLPRLCWKRCRSEPIFHLLRPMDDESDEMLRERAQQLAAYVDQRPLSMLWFLYARCFCSLAYLVLVLVQMFFMDKLLNGAFLTYGVDILHRDEAMQLLFPKDTACELHFYSESGALEKDSTLCVLPLNIFNEKLFVGMWFWFLFLAACSLVKIVLLGVAMAVSLLRVFVLHWRCGFLYSKPVIQGIVDDISVPQWYRLVVLSAQLDVDVFQKTVESLNVLLETEQDRWTKQNDKE